MEKKDPMKKIPSKNPFLLFLPLGLAFNRSRLLKEEKNHYRKSIPGSLRKEKEGKFLGKVISHPSPHTRKHRKTNVKKKDFLLQRKRGRRNFSINGLGCYFRIVVVPAKQSNKRL